MDFRLTEEQIMIRDTAKRISQEKIAPLAAEIDAQERFPIENFTVLSENGLLGVNIPEQYGGSGAGQLANCLVLEEVSKACGSTSTILTNQGLASEPFLIAASEEMKKNYLYRMASGQCQGAMAITEPNAGSDVAGMKTVAKKVDGGYVINGSKIFITNVGISPFIVLVCYTDKSKGNKGMSMLVVEKEDKGFIVGRPEHKLGLRGSDTRPLTFEDCFVPEDRLLGVEGGGFKTLMNTFNYSRPNIAAQALGFAGGALEVALAYVKERAQFGKTLSSFQGMQWMLADMALKVEMSRSIIYRAASLIDSDPGSSEIPRLCSMAKWYASDAAMSVTTDAVQILGGYGYTREYPVERMMRDAKITQIYEGTNQVQRIIIAGQMLK